MDPGVVYLRCFSFRRSVRDRLVFSALGSNQPARSWVAGGGLMKVLRACLGVVVLLSLPVAANAQDRGFFRPTVGAVVGAGPGAVFSGTVGINAEKLHKGLTVLGEFGRVTNVMPSKVADQVEVNSAIVATGLGGGKASSSASATANYGLGGVRYRFRDVSGAQTFGEFGIGVANVHSTVSARIIGSSTVAGNSSISSL